MPRFGLEGCTPIEARVGIQPPNPSKLNSIFLTRPNSPDAADVGSPQAAGVML